METVNAASISDHQSTGLIERDFRPDDFRLRELLEEREKEVLVAGGA